MPTMSLSHWQILAAESLKFANYLRQVKQAYKGNKAQNKAAVDAVSAQKTAADNVLKDADISGTAMSRLL